MYMLLFVFCESIACRIYYVRNRTESKCQTVNRIESRLFSMKGKTDFSSLLMQHCNIVGVYVFFSSICQLHF